MAGKTFPGIGELEDESPPVDPADAADSGAGDSRPFYSGPTVVDDLKVEEGLKKLRSLDAPPGPLTGITKAVVDALESGPGSAKTPIAVDLSQLGPPQVVAHHQRETAVGRNVVGPAVGQQEVRPPFDDRALRGTLFGHSIHAPEFALPTPEEPAAPGALSLLNRGAPTTTVAIYQPQRTRPGTPPEVEPFERSDRFRSTPLTPISVSDAPPRKKVVTRVAIGAAAILAIGATALYWARPADDSDAAAAAAAANRPQSAPAQTAAPAATPASAPTAPAAAPTPAAPTAATAPTAPAATAPKTPPPPAAARESEPAPMATAPAHPALPASRPAARPVPHAVPQQAAEPAEPAAEEAEAPARPHHTHSTPAHADRRHAPPGADSEKSPDTEAAPAAKPPRKRAAEDDPDATMAPSIE